MSANLLWPVNFIRSIQTSLSSSSRISVGGGGRTKPESSAALSDGFLELRLSVDCRRGSSVDCRRVSHDDCRRVSEGAENIPAVSGSISVGGGSRYDIGLVSICLRIATYSLSNLINIDLHMIINRHNVRSSTRPTSATGITASECRSRHHSVVVEVHIGRHVGSYVYSVTA